MAVWPGVPEGPAPCKGVHKTVLAMCTWQLMPGAGARQRLVRAISCQGPPCCTSLQEEMLGRLADGVVETVWVMPHGSFDSWWMPLRCSTAAHYMHKMRVLVHTWAGPAQAWTARTSHALLTVLHGHVCCICW